MPHNADLVTIVELATKLGMERSAARKFILKAGFEFLRTRTPASRHQLTLALTREDAAEVYRIRAERGFDNDRPVKAPAGQFYMIQISPDMNPKRVKLGYANNVEDRLATYRTLSPTAKVVASWPCKRGWEAAALDFIGSAGTHVTGEVYDAPNLRAMVRAGREFFAKAPKIGGCQ